MPCHPNHKLPVASALRKVATNLLLCLLPVYFLQSQSTTDSIAYYADGLKSDLHVNAERYRSQAQNLLRYSAAANRPDGIAEAHHALGVHFEEQALYDSAIQYQQQALNYWQAAANPEKQASVYNAFSVIYKDLGDYQKSIDYSLKGLRLADSLSLPRLQVYCRTNTGECYLNMGIKSAAASFFVEAKKIALISGDEDALAATLIYIGNMQLNEGKLDSAEMNYNEFIRIKTGLGNFDGMPAVLSNLGAIQFFRGDLPQAIRWYQQSITAAKKVSDFYQQTIAACNAAEAYMELSNAEIAHSYLDSAISLAHANKSARLLALAYQLQASLFERLNLPAKALGAYQQHSAYHNKMIDEERARQIANMEVLYQSERKEKQILQQALHIERQQAALFVKNAQVVSLLTGLAAVLVFGLIFYSRYKAKQGLVLQKAIIHEQEKGLEAVLLATEDERKRISKDLHDGIGQQLSGLKMAWQKMATDFSEKLPGESVRIQKLTDILDQSASEVRNISHHMMPKALLDLGLVAAIGDMLEKTFMYTGIAHTFEHYHAERRFGERVEISLYRVLQELINNIIKHSGATRVSVQLFVNKSKLIMVVEDNGRGFESEAPAAGHGLMNIKSRLTTLHGKVNYDPSPGAGTVATVTIPIADE